MHPVQCCKFPFHIICRDLGAGEKGEGEMILVHILCTQLSADDFMYARAGVLFHACFTHVVHLRELLTMAPRLPNAVPPHTPIYDISVFAVQSRFTDLVH